MNRRAILASSGAALSSVVAGCFGNAPEPKDYPSVPDPLTRDSVVEFVEAYETAEVHNRLLDEGSSPDSINVGCQAVVDRETDGGFYVVSACGGATTDEGPLAPWIGSTSVAHYEMPATTYRVDEEVHRVEVDAVEREGDRVLRLLNFEDADHELTVTLSRLETDDEDDEGESEADAEDGDEGSEAGDGGNDDDTELEATHELAGETGLEWWVDLADGERYELTAALERGEEATFEWDLPARSGGVGVYVTGSGSVEIGPLPRESPVS